MLDPSQNIMGTPLSSSSLKYSGIGSHESIVSPSFSSPSRFWRPAAQRNIRNQWSKLLSSKNRWVSAASEGRDHATKLVNAYLRQRDLPDMTLGDLNDIPGIRERCCDKLADKQDLWRSKLISSYKDMVVAVNGLVKASSSMRCYLKGSASKPIIQYSDQQEDPNDSGVGSGIPVFSFLSISILEDLARELVNMFTRELSLKVYLTTWISDLNIDRHRVKEIFSIVEEEMHAKLL